MSAAGHPGGRPGGHPHDVFHRQYAGGAPWDTGNPQPAFVAIEEAGSLPHRILDIGCGTGSLALYLAAQGHDVVGIDVVASAIDEARRRAVERNLPVRFEVADVLEAGAPGFPDLGGQFDTVVDVGFFHALSDEERPRLLAALERLMNGCGVYRFLCFSDKVPGTWGPRRISAEEIRATFGKPQWRVTQLAESELETARPDMPTLPAWLATIEWIGESTNA